MGKMFKINGKVMRTWNPFTGCGFECTYCWARPLAEGKLARSYPNGFIPEFHPDRLKVKFHHGETVFVSDMGDISFASWPALRSILEVIEHNPETDFLIQTKDPAMFLNGRGWLPNIIQGTTIETNREITGSKAPRTVSRYHSFAVNNHPRKMVSIEPIMDFDPSVFTAWILDIAPRIVQIGADNYRHNLPEPSWGKVAHLISVLESAGIHVEQKDGLKRLCR